MIDEVGHGSNQAGEAFILKWLAAWFYGDSYSAHATNKVLAELLVFYMLILTGFGLLYLTWRSNSKLKEWKKNLAYVVAEQRGRKFEPQDAARLYGMF